MIKKISAVDMNTNCQPLFKKKRVLFPSEQGANERKSDLNTEDIPNSAKFLLKYKVGKTR